MIVPFDHSLTVPGAIERLHGFTFALGRQYGVDPHKTSQSWNGNVLTYEFTGPANNHFHGTVTVDVGRVTVVVESKVFHGWVGKGIQKVARGRIESALKEALGD